MYFQTPLTLRQIVKNAFGGGVVPAAAGAFGRMKPIDTPRSPLDATITRSSAAQRTGLVADGLAAPIDPPILSLPTV